METTSRDVRTNSELGEPLIHVGTDQAGAGEFKFSSTASGRILGMKSYGLFKKNAFLSASMAFWVTLFFVPSCCQVPHDWLFTNNAFTTWVEGDAGDMSGYWPNVVQLMFFTVYFTTGQTVRLGWQGLMGTTVAGANIMFMGMLFPLGGKCKIAGEPFFNGGASSCAEYEDPNYGRFQVFVWFDLVAFIIVLLLCNAEENTMKFGMSWHLTYMMLFMSDSGYTPSHSVTVTSIIGVCLAIVVTLVPFHHLTIVRVDDYPEQISDAVREFTTGALELAHHGPNWSRYKLTATKFSLETKAKKIPGIVANMSSDYADSWWETFNMGRFGPLRIRCKMFMEAFGDGIAGFDDILYTMAKATMAEKHDLYGELVEEELAAVTATRHTAFEGLHALAESTLTLLHALTTDFVKDGTLPSEQMFQAVKDDAASMRRLYDEMVLDLPSDLSRTRKILFTNLNLFVFSLLALSERVLSLADQTEARNAAMLEERRSPYERFILNLFDEIRKTWTISFLDMTRMSFVARNALALVITFVMGRHLSGNIFVAGSATMCTTLAVLVTHAPGSHVYQNLLRVLGLALGKVIPIIVMAAVSVVGQQGVIMEMAHLFAVFVYFAYFSYVYYTSPEWSYVGCIIAGFGCYGLVGTRATGDSETLFASRYQELGQVTVAIMIQVAIDCTFTALQNQFPRDIAVRQMRRIGMSTDAELDGMLVTCFSHFFHGNFDQMKATLAEVKQLVAIQEATLKECDNKTIVSRGPSLPFKTNLCQGVLDLIKKMLCEMDTIILCEDFKVGSTKPLDWNPIFDHYKIEVLRTLRYSLRALQFAIEQKSEGCINVKIAQKQQNYLRHLDSSLSLRATVATRALHDIVTLAYEIEHLSYSSGVFS